MIMSMLDLYLRWYETRWLLHVTSVGSCTPVIKYLKRFGKGGLCNTFASLGQYM